MSVRIGSDGTMMRALFLEDQPQHIRHPTKRVQLGERGRGDEVAEIEPGEILDDVHVPDAGDLVAGSAQRGEVGAFANVVGEDDAFSGRVLADGGSGGVLELPAKAGVGKFAHTGQWLAEF
jgi:hypothetical protein